MRSLILGSAAVFGLLLCMEGNAQVFRLTGGASSGFRAQGAGIEVLGKGYEAWSGAGFSDHHLIFGSFLKLPFRDYTIKLGDDDAVMTLPIDIFGTQSTLHTRGVSLDWRRKRTTYHLFTGQMGTAFASPMFRAGTSSGPLAVILFTDTQLTSKVRLFSRNIFSTSRTNISGAEWRPSKGYTFSVAAGAGSDHLYSSEAASVSRERYDLKLAYVAADNRFQRSVAGTPLESELDGANITAIIRPTPSTGLSFGHQNYLAPQLGQLPGLRSQVDHLSGSWKTSEFEGPTLGAAVFRSQLLNRTSRGASLWAAQSIGPLDLRLNYLASATDVGAAVQSLSLTTQEKLTARLSALQVSTFSSGRTNVAFGGNLLTNRITIGVNYQTLYVPFRPEHPFSQALSISLNLNLRSNLHLSTATSFTPQGRMIYTLAGSGSFYSLSGLEAAPQLESFSFHGYVINGQVTTADGLPVYGAAIRVGKELLYSDRRGRFLARERRAGLYKVEVVNSEFIATGNFSVVSAPHEAAATKDQEASGIAIVLARS